MSRLIWDQTGKREFETGTDHGVFYNMVDGAYPKGVVWDGLISVSENPSGAEDNPYYADNIKYFSIRSAEDFGATIECYTYPREFMKCNGDAELSEGISIGQQDRQSFGFSYRTLVGNDTNGTNRGYKIHLVYNASASPSERSYQTVNDSPEAITFSFEISTTPIPVKDHKPTAVLTIDSTKVDPAKLKLFEDILYGSDDSDAEPRLPLPDEVKDFFEAAG